MPAFMVVYSIPESGNVKLIIYNSVGEEVATLVNEQKSAGSYNVDFNAVSLPSGIYFYQLRTGSFVGTKKMVIMK